MLRRESPPRFRPPCGRTPCHGPCECDRLTEIKRLVGGPVIANARKADAVKGMLFVGQPEIR